MTTPTESANSSAPKLWRELTSRRRWSGDTLLTAVLPTITLALIVYLWDWAIRYYQIPPTTIPTPGEVFDELVYSLGTGTILLHTFLTLQEVVFGFVLGAAGGFALGVAVAEWKFVRMAISPFLVAVQMVPKVAIAPLFIMWIGYGIGSKVAIAASITFFPLLINTVAGLRSVDGDTIEMMRAFRATNWQVFHRVKLKFALPYIFAGLEVAMVLAVIGAIVAEFIGATGGLGYLILQATYKMETPQVFSVLVMLALLGIALNGVIRIVAKRALFWHDSERVLIG
jgi:NitT/TauT family transport system permease protein